jgi:hypothetical protein
MTCKPPLRFREIMEDCICFFVHDLLGAHVKYVLYYEGVKSRWNLCLSLCCPSLYQCFIMWIRLCCLNVWDLFVVQDRWMHCGIKAQSLLDLFIVYLIMLWIVHTVALETCFSDQHTLLLCGICKNCLILKLS